MNIVMFDRILELTEKKPRFYKIRSLACNWKAVTFVCVAALTLKAIAEQLAMMLIRN